MRATGSGSGCGSHWPLCNGEVIPRAASIETLIEFSHRVTSGLALILIFILYFWARRQFESGSLERKWASISLVLVLIEAAIGAGLVLLELVADNSSVARAAALGLHLVNTFLLLAALSFTAFYSNIENRRLLEKAPSSRSAITGIVIAIIILGITGAITALGDTIFPAETLAEGIRADLDSGSSFLIKLRVIHPSMAVLISIFAVGVFWKMNSNSSYPRERRLAKMSMHGIGAQLIFGFVNLLLLAPIWTQLVHLLLADIVWISIVLLWSVQAFSTSARTSK